MAQLTVYIDDENRRKIEIAARCADRSVSQWVKQKLTCALETEWSGGYFEWLGSLQDIDLERPEQPRQESDASAQMRGGELTLMATHFWDSTGRSSSPRR